MMESTGLSPFQPDLDTICQLLYERDFEKAEAATLRVLCSLLEKKSDGSHKQFIVSLLYHSFNSYYSSWLKKQNYNMEKELDDLRSLEHDNLLIAYCSNVYAMEMLLKQAFEYFSPRKKTQDMLYFVENYKMVYLM